MPRSPWPIGVPRDGARRPVVALAAGIGTLAAATVAVGVVENVALGSNASAVYLVAVVAMALWFGTWPAVGTAVAAFLLYDFLFTHPIYTFTVAAPVEWVNLLLFLLVATVVGRLTAQQTERAADADRRARESQALFAISRILATASSVDAAAPAVLDRLAAETGMRRIWFATRTAAGERTLVDSAPSEPRPRPRIHWLLVRTPGEAPARWVRAHDGQPARARQADDRTDNRTDFAAAEALYRVRVDADAESVGSLWGTRPADGPPPAREETRLLALAADQLGLAVHRDRLAAVALAAEVARQSDALKSALLTSVSHDLRTPLASIRAAAGTLIDPAGAPLPANVGDAARLIDAEAERLNRLVANLLDLSRIEGGGLRPAVEVLDIESVLEPVVARAQPLFDGRPIRIDMQADLPPIRGDAVFVDEMLTNLLENAARYAGPLAHVRVTARADIPGEVTVTVEDDGPGVPADALPHLFDKFYRVGAGRGDGHSGMGIGMSVVKGLVEAMDGRVAARRSPLGGLAVDVGLRSLAPPPVAT